MLNDIELSSYGDSTNTDIVLINKQINQLAKLEAQLEDWVPHKRGSLLEKVYQIGRKAGGDSVICDVRRILRTWNPKVEQDFQPHIDKLVTQWEVLTDIGNLNNETIAAANNVLTGKRPQEISTPVQAQL